MTAPTKQTVTIPLTVDADDFWSAILGSGFETWDWWRGVTYDDNSAWDKAGHVVLKIENPDGGPTLGRVLNVNDLAKAYALGKERGYDVGDYEDFDACSGDAVLQIAVLGDIIYG